MLIIDSSAALARALDQPIDPNLKRLLALRRDQLAEYEDDLINFVVVQPGDTIADVGGALGFSPFVSFVDGTPFGEPGYSPPFEWCADHGGLFEAPIIFSDDGAGVVLIVQNKDGMDADLLALMRAYAVVSQELRTMVLGGDPCKEKAEKKAVPLYGELADQHIAHARTHARSIKTIEGYIDNHIRPKWGKVRLTDIHPRDVSKWLAEKREGGLAPATAEKIRVIFGRSFALAAGWGVAGAERNPTKGVSRPKFTNARERFLTAGEAARLREAVAASRNTQLRYIVGLLLLTGARVSELLNAEWRHVDVERRAWHIPISKTGKSRHVPLSQAALDLIAALPKFKDCPYLVPNPETLKPFVSIKHSWQTARDEAKLPGLRIHDLRHSAASFMINSGVDLFAVGKVLGHASYQSTQRYSHLANDTLLAAVEAGAKKQNAA
jgi:integrase